MSNRKALRNLAEQVLTNYCPDCNSDYIVRGKLEPGRVTTVTILHDPTCPTFARMR